MSASESSTRGSATRLFLPDFCQGPAVLAIVLIAELVAIIFAIARQALHENFWIDLASSSLFLLWVGLICAAVLCRIRLWLQRLPAARAAMIAIGLLVATVGIVSEVVYQIGSAWGPGNLESSRLYPNAHVNFLLRNIAVGFIVSALALRYFYVSAEWKRSIEMEALARIRALQARIRPHFLFNSMNTIAALTRTNPRSAEQAVEDLADLFRASLAEADTMIMLREELDIARTHQRIEQLRLDSRLRVEWHLDDLPLNTMVPSLIVQPLLENAVYHGIEMLPAGGVVTITGCRKERNVEIEVRNPIPAQSGYDEREGNRMALENIRQRLELAWPGRAHIETRQTEGEFSARLVFPYADGQEGK
ncbi:sensor histidine kinase [Povalibacter sp.]|uniref:sensor histidine kinase n=1 Tax=Povalibacter sp. TaxID=1962978 RepID=UPI002F423C16